MSLKLLQEWILSRCQHQEEGLNAKLDFNLIALNLNLSGKPGQGSSKGKRKDGNQTYKGNKSALVKIWP